jgi:phage terminase small subunit
MLTDMEKSFVENFTLTGNATESARLSGYSDKTAKQQGYQLKERLKDHIDKAIKEKMRSSVPIAVETLQKLIQSEKIPPSTRLQAVNSLLDRTGLGTSSTTHIEDITHKRSSEDLKIELNNLLQSLSIVKVPNDDDSSNGGNNVH